LNCPHGLSTDQESNFYVADCFGGRGQKLTPQPIADAAKPSARSCDTLFPGGDMLISDFPILFLD
jgi:hypothetical protein